MHFDLRQLADAVARGIGNLSGSSPDERAEMWQGAQQFATRVLTAAAQKWLPFFQAHHVCSVKALKGGVPFPCGGHAILACDACGEPACMHHVQVDQHGDGTCFTCIAHCINEKRAARGASAAPPPGASAGAPPVDQQKIIADIIKKSLHTLGLKPGASWADISRAHREKASKHHPDRAKTAAERKRFNDKTVAANAALSELKRHYPGPRAVA